MRADEGNKGLKFLAMNINGTNRSGEKGGAPTL